MTPLIARPEPPDNPVSFSFLQYFDTIRDVLLSPCTVAIMHRNDNFYYPHNFQSRD